jgi:cold shock protein
MTGEVKRFDAAKGWGFVVGEDGKDYFCHFTDILMRGSGFRTLTQGQKIDFEPVVGDKGLKATNITVL